MSLYGYLNFLKFSKKVFILEIKLARFPKSKKQINKTNKIWAKPIFIGG
jgi:hypothetical protein